jgi:AraC-like DNA-binding protein
MSNFASTDFFSGNPIKEFIGAGFEKYRPQWQWKRNLKNASFYFIADGSLVFESDSFFFTAKKGDVVFLEKNDIATIRNENNTYSSLYYIAFNYDDENALPLSTHYTSTPHINLFKDILDSHRSKAPYSNLRIMYLFHRLIYSLLLDSLKSEDDYILTSRINSAAEYININYYKNITMEQLCSITGYSPAHLRRLFIRTFGVPPQTYILNKRIEIAKEMLLDIPQKTIDEIADLLGMSSASYFCKLFKEKTSISPAAYRQKHKQSF